MTGGTGFLGGKLLNLLGRRHQVLGTCHRVKKRGFLNIDITKRETVNLIESAKPDVVIHTVAWTSPDLCELNKETAWDVNVVGTRNVAWGCKNVGCKMVYVSSDYVFDTGVHSENSSPNPPNYYGQTKLEGEREVKEELSNYLIVRPTAMYGFSGREDRFVAKVRNSLSKGRGISLSPDVIKYPVLVDDVARFISTLLENDSRGTYHISGRDPVSRYDWARLIAETYSLNGSLISPGREERLVPSVSGVLLLSTRDPLPEVVPLKEGLEIGLRQERCILRTLYFKEVYEREGGKSVAGVRERLGALLAKESVTRSDIVCPIPNSGYYYALGFSRESGIPIEMALQKEREERVLFKRERTIEVIEDLARGKRVTLVDEALFTGGTLKQTSERLRRAGAVEVHARIVYSPLAGCKYRVLEGLDLFHGGEIVEELELDSIGFLSPENYPNHLKDKCVKCWLDPTRRRSCESN